ncbi:MAG: hypothetical protein J6K33_04775 [Alistipes sp.]|nr:hypothetical protein [Alistipes sp.]
MKKSLLVALVSLAFVGCSQPAKLTNSATHVNAGVVQPVMAIFADLDVSPKKITYFYIPSQTVKNGGLDNVINTAVREALAANGDADAMIALEKQIKFTSSGEVESITITGYPAKYTNFRNPGDEYLRDMTKSSSASSANQSGKSMLGGLKFGKK